MVLPDELVIIGDQHLKKRILRDRVELLFQLVEAIGRTAVWLGDLFDTKELINGRCLNAALEYFRTSKLTHIVIVGNHDYFNLDCDDHALQALKLLPNVVVIDAPTLMGEVVFLPYIHSRAKLEAVLKEYEGPNRVLFGHLEVDQFDFGTGYICTTGIPLSAFANYKRVISGHFHKFQESGNLTFLGTPYTQSQGEANQVKYLGLYSIGRNELKKAETDFPRHITVEVDCDRALQDQVAALEVPDARKHYFRIILIGKQSAIDTFPRNMYEYLNVRWLSRPTDFMENNVTIDETVSNEVQLVRWATEVKKMDPETVKLGLSILEACK